MVKDIVTQLEELSLEEYMELKPELPRIFADKEESLKLQQSAKKAREEQRKILNGISFGKQDLAICVLAEIIIHDIELSPEKKSDFDYLAILKSEEDFVNMQRSELISFCEHHNINPVSRLTKAIKNFQHKFGLIQESRQAKADEEVKARELRQKERLASLHKRHKVTVDI